MSLKDDVQVLIDALIEPGNGNNFTSAQDVSDSFALVLDNLDNLGSNYYGTKTTSDTAPPNPAEGATVTPLVDGIYTNFNNLERSNEICVFEYIGVSWVKKQITNYSSLFSNTVEESNTSQGASGKAVFDKTKLDAVQPLILDTGAADVNITLLPDGANLKFEWDDRIALISYFGDVEIYTFLISSVTLGLKTFSLALDQVAFLRKSDIISAGNGGVLSPSFLNWDNNALADADIVILGMRNTTLKPYFCSGILADFARRKQIQNNEDTIVINSDEIDTINSSKLGVGTIIIDNAIDPVDYGITITEGATLTIEWTGVILITDKQNPTKFAYIQNNTGTRVITLVGSDNVAYVLQSEILLNNGGILPVYYARWSDAILNNKDVVILASKNKSYFFKDVTGDFADFIRQNVNEVRIATLETEVASIVTTPFDVSDNESQNLFHRGKAEKDYTGVKKFGIITAGQSNADGRVPQIDAPIWLNQGNPELLGVNMWNATSKAFETFKLGVNTGASVNTTTLWSFDMVAYHLLQAYLSEDIYVIKRSRGGTAISEFGSNGGGYWDAYFERVPSGIVMTSSFEERIRESKTLADAANVEIKAFLWHQGEGDSLTPAQEVYYQNFKNVIAYVRGVVGNAKLPIIFGTIATASGQYSAIVEAAQLQIASEDPFAFVVDMSAGTLLDAYHFDAASSETLGTSMFNIIKDF